MIRTPWLLGLVALPFAQECAVATELARYSVTFDAAVTRAEVTLCLDRAAADVAFAPDLPRGMRFLDRARRSSPGPLDTTGSPWRAEHWRAGECLTYGADISAIADLHSEEGSRVGSNLVTDPQHWLLRADVQGDGAAEATLELPEGWSVSAPWPETGREGQRRHFRIPGTPPDWSASLVLGRFDEQRIELPGGALRVALLGIDDPAQRTRVVEWLRRVGQAWLTAYGRMPVADVQVSIDSVANSNLVGKFAAFLYPNPVLGGESARGQGNALSLTVDMRRPDHEFNEDWTAIHELSHMFHPYLGDRGSWLGEGLATYYQNVLRARGGMLTPARAWERLAAGFGRSGRGPYATTLEEAAADSKHPAFLRVYWSGAAYWLGVDADLRRASGGRVTLDTALSRFADCCLPAYREWKPEAFVARLDALLGVRTFSQRYREFARMKTFPDWRGLLGRLGVRADGDDAVTLDAAAPDARIRDAIMSTDAGTPASPHVRRILHRPDTGARRQASPKSSSGQRHFAT